MIAAAFDEAEARDPQHRRCWVVLVDGAAHQLKLIQKEADRRAVTVHIVLDIVHVIEKLWASARCFHTATDPAAKTWAGFKTARILADDASGAVRDLRSEAARGHLTDEQRATIGKTCHYLANNAAFVHYVQALQAGWPIASGIAEGAARHLVADRLDITGSRWSVPGAEALLQLHATISHGDLTAYWRCHVRQEHTRLRPRLDQADYRLTA